MRFPRALLFLLLLTLLVLGEGRARAQAAADAAGGPQEAGAAAELVAQLLAHYDANYRPDPELLDAAWQVQALGRQAERDDRPSFTLTERASLSSFERLDFELDLSATIPLYRSRTEPLAALQATRLDLLASEEALMAAEARSAFLRDLLSLALLTELEAASSTALGRVLESGWRAPASAGEALLLPPQELDLLALHAHVQELQRFATAQLPTFQRRVAKGLGQPGAAPPLPSFDRLEAGLLGANHAEALDVPSCYLASPLLEQTRLRHRQSELELLLIRTPDLRVALQGSASYRHGQALGQDGLNAAVSVEALLPLPVAAPASGQVGLAARLSGIEQTLRLSWPPPIPLSRPVDEVELAERKADMLEAVAAELSTLGRAVSSAATEVAAAETRLLLTARDLLGAASADVSALRRLAHQPAPDPVDELRLIQLRAELAFARLTYAERLLDLRLLCGEFP